MDRNRATHLILGLLACFLAPRRRSPRKPSGQSSCLAMAGEFPGIVRAGFTPVQSTPRRRGHHHLCRPFDLCDRDAGRRADRHRFQRLLRRDSAAARRHHEQGAPHALYRPSGPGIEYVLRGWNPRRRPGQTCAHGRRCLHPQRADRHPQRRRRWRPTAIPSSSSRSQGCASAISAICTIGWRTPTTRPSAGSTSSWCRSTAA